MAMDVIRLPNQAVGAAPGLPSGSSALCKCRYTLAIFSAILIHGVYGVDISGAIAAGGPQIHVLDGSMVRTCNSTWFATVGPSALGIGINQSRSTRVISSLNASSRPSPEGADLAGCDLIPLPWSIPQYASTNQSRWQWSSAMPGGVVISTALQPCNLTTSTNARADSASHTPSCLDNVTLSSPMMGLLPIAASPQEAPYAAGLSPRSSALLPPTRSVEPWTTEEWVLVFNQPTASKDNEYKSTGQLWNSGYQRYNGVSSLGEETKPWAPTPFYLHGETTPHGAFMAYTSFINVPVFRRTAVSKVPLYHCPALQLSSICQSDAVPIGPNDTCAQATQWEPVSNNASSLDCNDFWQPQPQAAEAKTFRNNNYLQTQHLSPGDSYHIPNPPGTKLYPYPSSGAGVDNRWHQVTTIVYPPGTVAELSVQSIMGSVAPVVSVDYPWQLNRGHVVQTIFNIASIPATLSVEKDVQERFYFSDSGSMQCDDLGRPSPEHFELNATMGKAEPSSNKAAPGKVRQYQPLMSAQVILADPACLLTKTCSPAVPSHQLPGSDSIKEAVRRWVRDVYWKQPIGQRIPRFACSLSYFRGWRPYSKGRKMPDTFDIIHSDYPAAASTRMASFGGTAPMQRPVDRGGWNSPTEHAGSLESHGRLAAAANDNITGRSLGVGSHPYRSPGPSSRWPLPLDRPVVQGPKARYRGAALWRAVAPSADRSLPAIAGGYWSCNETSPLGAYFMRPVCRAQCNDPRMIAIDRGIEESIDSDVQGYTLAASLARPYLTRWGGYPALRQSTSVIPRSDRLPGGVVASFGGWMNWSTWHPPQYEMTSGVLQPPNMQCKRDNGRSMSWESRWVQRESSGRALVLFTISIDVSQWPGAQTSPVIDIGLDYPTPTENQIARLEAEVGADVGDLLGEVDWTQRGRGIEVGIGDRVTSVPHTFEIDQVRPINVKVLSVRAVDAAGSYDDDPPSQHPRYESMRRPPVLILELNISVEMSELPGVRFRQNRDARVQRGRSAGALAQELTAILRGQRPGAEGGVWLPAAVPSSVTWSVLLPCLVRGYGHSTAECGGTLRSFWTGQYMGAVQALSLLSLAFGTAVVVVGWSSHRMNSVEHLQVGLLTSTQATHGTSGAVCDEVRPPSKATKFEGQGYYEYEDRNTPARGRIALTAMEVEQDQGSDLDSTSRSGSGFDYSRVQVGLVSVFLLWRWLQYVVVAVCLMSLRMHYAGLLLLLGLIAVVAFRELSRCACYVDPLGEIATKDMYDMLTDRAAISSVHPAKYGSTVESSSGEETVWELEPKATAGAGVAGRAKPKEPMLDSKVTKQRSNDVPVSVVSQTWSIREDPDLVASMVASADGEDDPIDGNGRLVCQPLAQARDSKAHSMDMSFNQDSPRGSLKSREFASGTQTSGETGQENFVTSTRAAAGSAQPEPNSTYTHMRTDRSEHSDSATAAPDFAVGNPPAWSNRVVEASTPAGQAWESKLRSHVSRHLSAAVLVRTLSALQWDAIQLLWSGTAKGFDLIAATSCSIDDMVDEWPRLRRFLVAAAAFRSLEDLLLLASMGWASACGTGVLDWGSCTILGSSVHGYALEVTDIRVYWDQLSNQAVVPVAFALAACLVSAAMTLRLVLRSCLHKAHATTDSV